MRRRPDDAGAAARVAPAVEAAPLLEVQGLTVRFPGVSTARPAVDRLDLSLAAGETLALVGESGCGKSTTALALMRLLPKAARVEGTMRFDGHDLLALDQRAMCGLRGRDLAMIFQEPMSSLNPVLSVGAQVVEALRLHEQLGRAQAARRAVELLERVRLPDPHRRFHAFPHELSGGQRQRVMIAMAIACRPRLLVADEPTTALDVTIQAQILELIDDLRRELSMAVLLITHDLGLVAQWADRVTVMHGGRALESGPTDALFAAPAHDYTRGLLGASLQLDDASHCRDAGLPEVVVTPDPATGGDRFELRRPAARDAAVRPAGLPAAAAPPPAPALIEVRDLTVQYDGRGGSIRAVDEVSFTIAAGETLGLVGESGCGKSSLSRALIGLQPATAGDVRLDGVPITGLDRTAMRPWRRQVQMVFQDPVSSLNPRHTVGEILDFALRLHGLPGRRDAAERQRRIAAIVERVGLPRHAPARYPHEFSGGQRQRVGIARALILAPRLVICDEPVSALDVSVRAQILNLLVDLQRSLGLSYLFISHDLAVVRYMADRVLVMERGRIVESADQHTLWTDPRHPYTRRLLEAVPGRRPDASDRRRPARRLQPSGAVPPAASTDVSRAA